MNVNKLRGKIVEVGTTVSDLADKLGVDRSTLYRKMNQHTLTIKEANLIVKELSLTKDEAMAIFFSM